MMSVGSNSVHESPDTGIVLSDGTRLSARVWKPADSTDLPVPAILEFLPYRKRDGTVARDELTHPHFASHGYVCLRVDMRGNGDSQGVMDDEYSPQELADAVEVINWIAAQDWCTGAVGMMGISWGGFNSLQVAALAPEPLKAIITLCSTTDRFADDIHYKGGCLLNANLAWGGTMLSYSSRAPDPALVGDHWRAMWLERLNEEPHLSDIWIEHQHRDAYWKHGSICEDYSAIKAATLAIGGWGDGYKNTVQTLVENLDVPVKGIVGPWVHKYPHIATPEPRIDFLNEALRWWDRWLKEKDTGVENDPDLRLFLLDSADPDPFRPARAGRWISQEFRNPSIRTLHLKAGALGPDACPFSVEIDSPADTGMSSGSFFALKTGPQLPGDQRRDDALSTCFESDVLGDDLVIVGAPEVTLNLVSNAHVVQIALRLCDVHPDGRANRITFGVLNLTHRLGSETPVEMPVGQTIPVTVKLDQIAYNIPAGHRLRLSISNAYWPLLWPAPGATRLTLTAGRLDLPLLCETTDPPVQFSEPPANEHTSFHTLREPSNTRETTFDQQSGMTHLRIVDDAGEMEDLGHGLINGSIAREWWDIHPNDPLSARGRTHWSSHSARGDWSVHTETYSEMWADAENFHVTARIEAFEDHRLIFEKDFSKSIRRDLV